MISNSNIQGRSLLLALWTILSLCSVELYAEEPTKNPQEATAAAGIEEEKPEPPVAQATPQQPSTFDLFELRVKGSTKLDKKQLERTLYPFLGPKKNLEAVDLARVALEDLYKAQGYQIVTVDIPEQDVKNGVVYL